MPTTGQKRPKTAKTAENGKKWKLQKMPTPKTTQNVLHLHCIVAEQIPAWFCEKIISPWVLAQNKREKGDFCRFLGDFLKAKPRASSPQRPAEIVGKKAAAITVRFQPLGTPLWAACMPGRGAQN